MMACDHLPLSVFVCKIMSLQQSKVQERCKLNMYDWLICGCSWQMTKSRRSMTRRWDPSSTGWSALIPSSLAQALVEMKWCTMWSLRWASSDCSCQTSMSPQSTRAGQAEALHSNAAAHSIIHIITQVFNDTKFCIA